MADAARYESLLAEQRFQLLVNSVTDYALYMLDADGRIATWNAGARRFKGYEAEEVIGRHFSSFFTEEDREAGLPERALKIAAAEGKFEGEGWRVRKDGTRFWAHVVVDPIRDDEGGVIGYAKITRDVTEKRDSEQALRESEQKFRLLVQGVRDYAIYMLDPDGLVTNWNSGAQAIKGYSAEEIVGQHFSRFYTDEDRARGEPARALATALREGKYEREAWRVRKDGTHFFANVVIDPIYDDHGRHIGFAKITRDVTERRRAQQEIEDTRAALLQSQKLQALGELTGGIAHDFNNLMTVIRGSADLLRRPGISDEKKARYLDAIAETADRAATLTSHLLAFGRRQALKPEVLDLNVRLDALGEVLSRTLGGGIQVRLNLAPSAWPVEADSAQLETALLNAAFNARDAMPEGGSITLATANRTDEDGEWTAITIADVGTGMPPEIVARVFEPFFTTKPVGKGTGLGLSQIHGFAAQSGGRAEIASVPGEGTTITILLPRSRKPIEVQESDAGEPGIDQVLSILLVEDNDHVREFATTLLEEFGHVVIAADSGESALPLFESNDIDLLFSDVVMPGISGIELAAAAREARPNLPVLLASGYSDEIVAGAGADFVFVNKPYNSQQLEAALREALESASEPA